jgi:hypothetical protein
VPKLATPAHQNLQMPQARHELPAWRQSPHGTGTGHVSRAAAPAVAFAQEENGSSSTTTDDRKPSVIEASLK